MAVEGLLRTAEELRVMGFSGKESERKGLTGRGEIGGVWESRLGGAVEGGCFLGVLR